MNRLAFAAVTLLPSIAIAHPGHSHAGMSPNHHLVAVPIAAGVGIGGLFLSRAWKRRKNDNK